MALPELSRKRPMRRHAFTLIELLVVVTIIALLIAILLPSLNKARATSRMIVCAANLKQFGIAANIYAAENRDWLLPQSSPSSTGSPGNRYEWYHNPAFVKIMGMAPASQGYYYNAPRGLICPDARWVLDHPAGVSEKTNKYALPGALDPNGYYRLDLSYGMSPVGIAGWWDAYGVEQSSKVVRGLKRVEIKRPGDIIYMMDSNWSDPTLGGRYNYRLNPDTDFITPANNWAIAWRHFYNDKDHGLCNTLFYDAHAEALTAGLGSEQMNDNWRWNP
ncbi:MAG: prepilin-type N-terminal cleavage/methylation domain-containing protein [Planctomycetes bacterium]|nr:prepilin-type N-terminal cleavage/methylation domain-containing protein [Planctomycetota bacterium]